MTDFVGNWGQVPNYDGQPIGGYDAPTIPSEAQIGEVLPAGFYWVQDRRADYKTKADQERELPSEQRAWKVRKTQDSETFGLTWAIVHVPADIPRERLPFERVGPLAQSMTDAQLRDVTPRTLGLWPTDKPSLTHQASEVAEVIYDSAGEVVSKVGSSMKWVVGGVAALAAIYLVVMLTKKSTTNGGVEYG